MVHARRNGILMGGALTTLWLAVGCVPMKPASGQVGPPPRTTVPARMAPQLIGAPQDWLNTKGKALQIRPGTVYLIDFWEYTCLNCLRTLPYLKEWNRRYARYGLVIVGIHTPEFAFAARPANVARAVQRLGITYPVLLDSSYRNWQAWQGDQGYWPRKFLVNADGVIVYDHAGEGGYAATELEIQRLLHQLHPGLTFPRPVVPLRPEDRSGAVCYPVTPEVYAGYRGHIQGQLGNVKDWREGAISFYAPEAPVEDGRIYLVGTWQTSRECLRHARTTRNLEDRLMLRYHALGCNAVVKSSTGVPFRLYVWQDGRPVPKQDAGADVRTDAAGRTYVWVDSPRMYRLVQNHAFGRHVLELASDAPDFELYSFTFSSCVAR